MYDEKREKERWRLANVVHQNSIRNLFCNDAGRTKEKDARAAVPPWKLHELGLRGLSKPRSLYVAVTPVKHLLARGTTLTARGPIRSCVTTRQSLCKRQVASLLGSGRGCLGAAV